MIMISSQSTDLYTSAMKVQSLDKKAFRFFFIHSSGPVTEFLALGRVFGHLTKRARPLLGFICHMVTTLPIRPRSVVGQGAVFSMRLPESRVSAMGANPSERVSIFSIEFQPNNT